jgi:nitrite reductase/ring-hydroxylating ferredoxin subunit
MRRHVQDGLPTLAADTYRVPVSSYLDEGRWRAEVEKVFRRRPVVLGFTAELREPGMYRAMTVVGVPVLLVRSRTGVVKGFLNACRHRGMQLVPDGEGKAGRFTCPYHAWSYAADDGRLLAIPEAASFGDVDRSCLGLVSLPVEERSGIIWGVLTPGSPLNLEEWLGDMAPLLEKLGLQQFEVFTTAELDGPNWKIAMEGYLETYHFASLHAKSFLPYIFNNMAMIDIYGQHLRLCTPIRGIEQFTPPATPTWDPNVYVQHSFMIFPNLQLSFGAVPSGSDPIHRLLVSQVFPGNDPGTSYTIQRIMSSRDVRGTAHEEEVGAFARLALTTVREEDYPATRQIQKTLRSGANTHFTFGRNEIAVQQLHRFLETILAD